MEGNQRAQTTTELMILDYMVCMAISRITVAIRPGNSTEHVEWFVNMVECQHQTYPVKDYAY